MSWTTERIAELENLWAEGLSTAEIGRRLGVSKNAVVGKAHRMRLPGRQSPIERKGGANRAPAKPRAKAKAQPKPAAAPKAATPKPAPIAAAPQRSSAPPPRKRDAKPVKGPSCQWPYGDPRMDDFHFCGAPAEPGKPYCSEHCAVAYNRVSVAQADAKAEAAAA